MNKIKIVFFTPTFNRTGSEIALYNLISNAENDFEMTVVSKITGELSASLPKNVKFVSAQPAFLSSLPQNSLASKALKKGLSLFNSEISFLQGIHKMYPSDLWYINTITQPEVMLFARRNKIPVILHVHELEQMYNCISSEQLNNMISYPELIIACSNTVAEVLQMCGRKDKIEVCYPAIGFDRILVSNEKTKEIRDKFGINEDAFLWTMAGTMDSNKNPSLFVDLANRLLQMNLNAKFMWISARNDDNGYVEFCKRKSFALKIADKIIWIPKQNDEYYSYLNACDGFVLTSNKESFSMVAAEAMYLGKPVLSFDCGGINEIITDQTGIIIPDFNIDLLVQSMISVMNKKFIFNAAMSKETALKFDSKIQKSKWEKIIKYAFSEIAPVQ
ncbi:MAG: glycosyltransferase [Bacteroidia bacterium]